MLLIVAVLKVFWANATTVVAHLIDKCPLIALDIRL